MNEYDELRIRIWKIGHRRYLVFANGPATAADVIALDREPRAYWQALREILQEDLGHRSRKAKETTRKRVTQLGRELFATLLPEAVQSCLYASIRSTRQQQQRLRLRFDVEPELMEIPFEILQSPPHKSLGAPARRRFVSVVRSLEGVELTADRLPQPLDEFEPLPVLVVAPKLSGSLALDSKNEIRELRTVIPGYLAALLDEPLQVLAGNDRNTRATLSNVKARIAKNKGKPFAALLIAHGKYDEVDDEVVVALEKNNGEADFIGPDRLEDALGAAEGLRLVVLAICFASKATPTEPFSGLAQALVSAGVPAVVGMQTEVSNQAASAFSKDFLKEIYQNHSVDEAMVSGRLAMARNEWSIPTLFLHRDCSDSYLFKVKVDDEQHDDPIREGDRCLQSRKKDRKEMEVATRYARKRNDWESAVRFAKGLVDLDGSDETYRRLKHEAMNELQVGACKEICELLIENQEPDEARRRLEQAKKLFVGLDEETDGQLYYHISQRVGEEDELLKSYEDALLAEEGEGWERAIELYEAILARREEGFLDTAERLDAARLECDLLRRYQEAEEILEEGKDWARARQLYQDITAERADYKEATEGLSYAEARLAEERRKPAWRSAASSYRALQKLRTEAGREGPYRDVAERLPYARGRDAESREAWTAAHAVYRRLGKRYRDLADRAPYVAGRAAEDGGRWAAAVAAYEKVDPRFEEVSDRLAYARGRAAELVAGWQGVLDGFGALPDDYRDVRWRRAQARARLAEADERWDDVLRALEDVADSEGEGEAGSLRAYAKGRRAEDASGWKTAAGAYQILPDDYRDGLAARRAYARGRAAEEAGDWTAAADAYAALGDEPPGEVAKRRTYAEGRASETRAAAGGAEAEKAWKLARAAFSRLDAADPDIHMRLVQAEARLAEAQAAWQVVIHVLEPAEIEVPDGAALLAYARGRLAEDGEDGEDWSGAIASFARCTPYRDSEERLAHAQGRREEAEGCWQHALDAYQPLPADFRDIAARRQRLAGLGASIPWADGLASAGLAADPAARHFGVDAYGRLRAAGITPGSSLDEVQNASFALMERGGMDAEVRRAWDRLRSADTRLAVDALLYPVADSAALRAAQGSLVAESGEQALAALAAASPEDAPLLHLLAGEGEVAITAWEGWLGDDPLRTAAAHHLALAHLWRALEHEGEDEPQRAAIADPAWERSIACWTLVLADDAYWRRWAERRAVRYQKAISGQALDRLRRTLAETLRTALDELAVRHEGKGERGRAARCRELALLFAAELEGARLLGQVNGLPLDDAEERRLCCGTLFLRRDLRSVLGQRLGSFLARLERDQGPADEDEDELRAFLGDDFAVRPPGGVEIAATPPTTPALRFRLRCAFSILRTALVLLAARQPERALRALPQLYRQQRAELPPDCPDHARSELEIGPHLETCAPCQHYLAASPGYLRLPSRGQRLRRDAAILATRAQLELAEHALGRQDGLQEACSRFDQALVAAKSAGAAVRARRAISRLARARARALAHSQGRARAERLSAALLLLERTAGRVGNADDGQLQAKTAEILTERGIWYGYGCHEYAELDYHRAIDDLRRALRLAPDSIHARDNLARALVAHAGNMPHVGDPRPALARLSEALEVVDEGLRRAAGHRRLESVLARALEELEERLLAALDTAELARRLTASAGAAESEGDPLFALVAALRREAGDAGKRQDLIAALRRRGSPARPGSEHGDTERA